MAILIVLLCLTILYTVVLLPLHDRRAAVLEELQVKARTLQKYRRFLDAAPDTEREAGLLQERLEKYEAMLLEAENDSIAFARLNSYVQQLMEDAGLEIVSVKPLNVVKYRFYTAIPVQINAKADTARLVAFLQRVAAGRYLVSVDSVSVRVFNIRKPGILRVKIEMAGYRRT